MKFELEVTKVKVITRPGGTDIVIVDTNLPPAYPPNVSTESVSMMFYTQKGKGKEYVLNTMKIPEELVTVQEM